MKALERLRNLYVEIAKQAKLLSEAEAKGSSTRITNITNKKTNLEQERDAILTTLG